MFVYYKLSEYSDDPINWFEFDFTFFLLGSIVGLKGNAGQSAYSASKGGLVGFSRALAKEVARKKIKVNVVAPGQ